MVLCAQIDVERRIQTTFTNQPEPVITALITAAQARIESYVGRPVESATYTDEVYDPPRGAYPLRLKHWPVTAITALSVDDVALTVADDITFYEVGTVYRTSNGSPVSWNVTKRQSIKVTYTGGYVSPTHDTALEMFRDICAWSVANAFETGRAIAEEEGSLAGITSEQVRDYAVSYASRDDVHFEDYITLSPAAKDWLSKYRGLLVA